MNDIEEAHLLACQRGESLFVHPTTGLMSMTREYLKCRKKCCGNKCAFCPFKHSGVKNHICNIKQCPYVTNHSLSCPSSSESVGDCP
jgi:hypothetical protein